MASPVVQSPARRARRGCTVELVGPAGAGKSTLAKMLCRLDPSFRPPLTAWDLSPWVLATHGVRELPTLVRSGSPLQRSQHGCVLDLTRIMGLCARLQQQDVRRCDVVLLDEGPIFLLTRVLAYRRAALRSATIRERWEEALRRCAAAIQEIIWIDAPDPQLAERIRTRAKPHRLKAASAPAIAEFSARYRAAFLEVTSLFPERSPRVTCVTADEPVADTAERIARALRCIDGD